MGRANLKRLDKAVEKISKCALLIGLEPETYKLLGIKLSAIYDNYVASYGKRFALGLMKSFYQESMRYALRDKVVPMTKTWVKRDKDNYPQILRPFKVHLRNENVLHIRWTLTLLRAFEHERIIPIKDLSTILSPSKGPKYYQSELREGFLKFMRGSAYAVQTKNSFNAILEHQKEHAPKFLHLYYSTKAGPKGPTCATAGKQSLSIYGNVRFNIVELLVYFGLPRDDINKVLDINQRIFQQNDDLFPKSKIDETLPKGKITWIPDKGDKSRTVAIGNYWTQVALRQLHKLIFKVLKQDECDGTFNQNDRAEAIKANSATTGIASVDLSAATDRFLIDIQLDIIEFLNPLIGEAWKELVGNWSFMHDGKILRYEVGQPMGLLSSWAVFALSHHFLVQFAAHRTGSITKFYNYRIIGDDVAIWDELVAKEYLKLLDDLDITVNKTKSFLPEDFSLPCNAEFAKRIFSKGIELSAVSPDLITQSSDFVNVPEFLVFLEQRGLLPTAVPVATLVNYLGLNTVKYPSAYKRLLLLLHITSLLRGKTYVELTFGEKESLKPITIKVILQFRLQLLAEQLTEAQLYKLYNYTSDRVELATTLSLTKLGEDANYLYFQRIVDSRIYDLEMMIERLSRYIPMEYYHSYSIKDLTYDEDLVIMLDEIEYAPKVDFQSLLSGLRKEDQNNKKRQRSELVDKLSKLCISNIPNIL